MTEEEIKAKEYSCLKGYVTLDEALRNLGYKKEK